MFLRKTLRGSQSVYAHLFESNRSFEMRYFILAFFCLGLTLASQR